MHAHELGLNVKNTNSLRWGNLKNNIFEPKERRGTRDWERFKAAVISTENRSAIVSVGSERQQDSLVGLQVLYGDQHAFLMEPRGGVLLRDLLTLLSFVTAWFL